MQSHSPCADMIDEVTLTDLAKKVKNGGTWLRPLQRKPEKYKSELRKQRIARCY